MSTINKISKNILVIVAYPYDNTIGLEGANVRNANGVCNIFALAMTNGGGARKNVTEHQIKSRAMVSKNAVNLMGLTWLDGHELAANVKFEPWI
ncbi:hypothetical protein FIT76_04250 [Candidatus Methylopumilus universalis]|uniref:hypothetical protein n=1 Tax=Candidatus Methylopumilus universalis TaxID=2588536 RepID=UPI001124A354|nr:hypothetical protein [Candidatus Methylopumilus universalis]QDC47518.1 hypothetical protein FIT76_04250 [Candidatus Methylopumilus universalis]QDC72051.1 hypothetical protein FIT75_04300 [Candidatus Methylopumilus universalis]